MNAVQEREKGPDFIRLKVTNKMPPDICAPLRRELVILFDEFLRVIFTKVTLSQFVEHSDGLYRLGFTHSNESNGSRLDECLLENCNFCFESYVAILKRVHRLKNWV
jgi:hypothetical protein